MPKAPLTRNLRNTNWHRYREELDRLFPEDREPTTPANLEELEYLFDHFTACSKAIDIACPKKQHRGRKKPPWWNEEIKISRKKCRKTFNQATASGREGHWETYKTTLREYKKLLRRSKRTSWKDFCNGVESISEAGRLRKILSGAAQKAPRCLQRPNGSWTETEEESLDLLLFTHFPGATDSMPVQPHLTGDPSVTGDFLTKEKVIWSIGTFKPYKSPGPDGIAPIQLQQTLQRGYML
ncbi:uncharacterized protein LOC118734048 [Rhagoletis pomonella]|uniref:uncharacterized protein LOC118734048 n=1 Tax=Rhagoletis pomonella TaxID=28610 RepID=UPI001780643A|nr:uncharacterized protein LOC118734048 [Rhagoletis pomonella]